MYDDVILFIKIVRIGSFTKASRNLGMTPSTLTRRIQKLEKELGFTVIKRNTRMLELSKSGKQLYDKFKHYDAEMEEAITAIKSDVADVGGVLNIALPPCFAAAIITPHLLDFMTLYPHIKLNISYQNDEINLIQQNFDLAIVNRKPRQLAQKIKLLCRSKIILYCYPEYIKQFGLLSSVDEVEEKLILGVKFNDCSVAKNVLIINRISGKEKVIQLRNHLVQNTQRHMEILVESGKVIGGGLDVILAPGIRAGKIIHILPDYYIPGFNYYLLISPQERSMRANLFIQFIYECMGRLNLNDKLEISKITI